VLWCKLRKFVEQTSIETLKPPPMMKQKVQNMLGVMQKTAANVLVVLDGEQWLFIGS
jgi:hypothetical protein